MTLKHLITARAQQHAAFQTCASVALVACMQASAGAAPSEAATPVMASHSTQADNALAANATPAQRDSLLFEHDPSIDAVADAHFLSRADEARYASLVDELEGLRRGMAEQPEPPSGTEDPEFLTQEELASLEKLLDEQITELEQAERQGNLHRQTPADIRQALMAAQRATIQEQQVEEDRLRAEGKEPEPFPFDLSHRPRTVNFAGVCSCCTLTLHVILLLHGTQSAACMHWYVGQRQWLAFISIEPWSSLG